ncbi:MAG TPA: four helix bundle protein [Mycobacterium sp.]|nr:four helix bundle protein [Mycobacterium sp.]
MTEGELKLRTKRFPLRIRDLGEALPESRSGRVVASQLGRSATSAGANARAVGRSRSAADMISKLAVVDEEADESAFGLELVADSGLWPAARVAPLLDKAGQLTAIMVSSRPTLSGIRESRIENRK